MIFSIFRHFLIILNRQEEETMEVIYVQLIIKGKRTYASVPAVIKPQVREILEDMELYELIKE